MLLRALIVLGLFCAAVAANAREIQTNSIQFINAPSWLQESKLDNTTGRIEDYLEWGTHRIKVYWHSDELEFKSLHHLNFVPDAFFNKADSTVHLGPTVNASNFDKIFGHEMVHAIFYQKYKGAIPPWLEEGLANYIGKTSSVDYKWLATQDISDVTSLRHPSKDPYGSRYHYQVSTALIEMISSKCKLKDLLQLSVGAKMTTYLSTYCEINDINSAFKAWVKKKAGDGNGVSPAGSGDVPWWKKKKANAQ